MIFKVEGPGRMRIRRGKVPGIRGKAVHIPVGPGRMAAWGEMTVPAEDLSSDSFTYMPEH